MRKARSREIITERATEEKASNQRKRQTERQREGERVAEDHIWIYPFYY